MDAGRLLAGIVAWTLLSLGSGAVPAAQPPVEHPGPMPEATADLATQRAWMVRVVRFQARLAQGETGVAEIDPRVLAALGEVPRHAFVPGPLIAYSYLPGPLPVHPEQNLAAPFLVALMTHLARVEPDHRVLETGTGEGYHAAVLARLAAEVYSVEVIPELARDAERRLTDLGQAANVRVREADGYDGWPEAAPFDAIIVKEAVDHVPAPLLAQLKPGGRLVLPLGPADGTQRLTVVHKAADGSVRDERGLEVRFSPFQGGERI